MFTIGIIYIFWAPLLSNIIKWTSYGPGSFLWILGIITQLKTWIHLGAGHQHISELRSYKLTGRCGFSPPFGTDHFPNPFRAEPRVSLLRISWRRPTPAPVAKGESYPLVISSSFQWNIPYSSMIYGDLWWFMMVYDDLWWFMMIYGDLWWFTMVYDDLPLKFHGDFPGRDGCI
jgi:hypothetical protein